SHRAVARRWPSTTGSLSLLPASYHPLPRRATAAEGTATDQRAAHEVSGLRAPSRLLRARLLAFAQVASSVQPLGCRSPYFLRTSFRPQHMSLAGAPFSQPTPLISRWSSSTMVSVASCMCLSFLGSRLAPPAKRHTIWLAGDFGSAFMRGWLPSTQ